MTKQQLIYDILGLITRGRPTDNERLSNSNVSFWIDNTRAELIRNSLNKGQSLNPDIVQTISCLEVQLIDASECPCDIQGCTILRSVSQLPSSIEINQKNLITQISSALLPSKPFSIIPFARAGYAHNGRFSKKGTKAFIHNRYVYLITDTMYDKIVVSGVFESPEALNTYSDCSGNACYTDNSPYPMALHMVETMKKMILDTNIKIFMSTQEDQVNDAN